MTEQNMRISRLVLEGVGVFERIDLRFRKNPNAEKAEIHIFTGENGTGKTTLLQALTYFDFWLNQGLKNTREGDHGRSWDPLYHKWEFHRRSNKEANVGIHFGNLSMEFYLMGRARIPDSQFFKIYYSEEQRRQRGRYATDYSFFAYDSHFQLIDSKVEAFQDFKFDPILEALTFRKTYTNTSLFQWIANNKTRSALSFQKGDVKRSEEYNSNIRRVELAIGEIIGREVEFIIEEYSLNIMVKLDGHYCHFDALADGYRSVINWLTDLLFRLDLLAPKNEERFTLFLDEIDIHLHPSAQRRILPVIQKLFPKAQIFLSTHSPFVIGSVDDAWIYKLKRNKEGNAVLDGKPFRSEDAKSYQQILGEVFDVTENFGIAVEDQLKQFYELRNSIMHKYSAKQMATLIEEAKRLAEQSEELRAIVGSEIRQLARITGKEIVL
jgi:predicted ATP-binding protein involved in virulence